MNRFSLTILLGFISVFLFIFDKSIQGIFDIANYFSFTITFLVILINIKNSGTFIPIFFMFGLLCDWFNKSFIGIYPLISIIAAYLFNLLKYKVAGNKLALFLSNLIVSYTLYLVFFNFKYAFTVNLFIGALATSIVSSVAWLKYN